MKRLYNKLLELLEEIPELKYIDLNFGQIMEEKPPLAYPAVLINIGVNSTDTFHDIFQQFNAEFTLSLVVKAGDTSSLTEENRREQAMAYLDLPEKIYNKLQGYKDNHFDAFTFKGGTEQNLRKGLKTFVLRYSCGWKQEATKS
ncbi:hypothetical protein D1Z97_11040 [Riemerella anatipestifer]|uniref:hypothetical protein n=1 Tax=Riemerella anatipestifer TaxID=34085 RepID=UPI00129D343A|nr:hypothetical protein [Riemerella anatipestifer]MRN01683.1 hypothetical protein [Riemerella anatipestifer]MRN03773.1 hypothetical protein [Riemerella anatipestifer]